jgi:hypothetical protein
MSLQLTNAAFDVSMTVDVGITFLYSVILGGLIFFADDVGSMLTSKRQKIYTRLYSVTFQTTNVLKRDVIKIRGVSCVIRLVHFQLGENVRACNKEVLAADMNSI